MTTGELHLPEGNDTFINSQLYDKINYRAKLQINHVIGV